MSKYNFAAEVLNRLDDVTKDDERQWAARVGSTLIVGVNGLKNGSISIDSFAESMEIVAAKMPTTTLVDTMAMVMQAESAKKRGEF